MDILMAAMTYAFTETQGIHAFYRLFACRVNISYDQGIRIRKSLQKIIKN